MRLLVPLLVTLSVLAAEIPISESVRFAPADASTTARYAPVTAAGDEGFLVLWEQRWFAGYPAPLAFRAYDASGAARQPEEDTLLLFGHTPRAVWTGNDYLVVYATGSRFGYGYVYALRIAADGTVRDQQPGTVLVDDVNSATVLDLVWDGRSAWALLQADATQQLVELDALARVVGSRTVSGASAIAARSKSGPPWILAVQDGDVAASRPGGIVTIDHTTIGAVVALRDEDGRVLDSFIAAPANARIRNLAWDGAAWIAAYATQDSLCTLRFTNVTDLTRECTAADGALDPWIAPGFVTWTEGTSKQAAPGHGRVMTTSGVASTVAVAQRSPAATVDPMGLLAAWVEDSRIHIGGLNRAEQILTTDPIQGPIDLANAESQSLLVFAENGIVRATILDARGVPILERILLGEGSAPRVAALGGEWLVMWRTDGEVVSTVVSRSGNANGLQHHAIGVQDAFAISATSGGFLLVRSEGDRKIAERLDRNGSPIGASDLAIPFAPRVIRVQPDGGLVLYGGVEVAVVDPNGAVVRHSTWAKTSGVELGTCGRARRRTIVYVYSCSGRVYANDFADRARAARH